MTMTYTEMLTDYQEKSARTLNHACHVKRDYNYILGLRGESGEVADAVKKHVYHGHGKENIQVEVGDVFWYVAAICTNLGLEMGKIYRQVEPPKNELTVLAVDLGDDVSDAIFALRDTSGGADLEITIRCVIQTLHRILIAAGFCLRETLDMNVAKLMQRYQTGFGQAASLNRGGQ